MDTQELSITVTSQLPEDQVKFYENVTDPSSISTTVFLNEQEWTLFSYVNARSRTITDTFKGYNRSAFTVSAFAVRKARYFLNKYFFFLNYDLNYLFFLHL